MSESDKIVLFDRETGGLKVELDYDYGDPYGCLDTLDRSETGQDLDYTGQDPEYTGQHYDYTGQNIENTGQHDEYSAQDYEYTGQNHEYTGQNFALPEQIWNPFPDPDLGLPEDLYALHANEWLKMQYKM